MSQRPCFVVFEGLDGSGKSTCARLVAEHLGAALMTTPSPAVREYRDALVEALGPAQEARQLFYLSTVFAASEEVTRRLGAGESVVLDRYFLSTQAYAAFRGSALGLDALGELLRAADATIYLDTPLSQRRARLERRGMSAADLETITEAADVRLRHEHLRRAQLPVMGRFLMVDGGLGDQEEVSRRVLGALASGG
jgi:dTMP kinase